MWETERKKKRERERELLRESGGWFLEKQRNYELALYVEKTNADLREQMELLKSLKLDLIFFFNFNIIINNINNKEIFLFILGF